MKKPIDTKDLWDRGIRKSLDDPFDNMDSSRFQDSPDTMRLTLRGKVILGLILLVIVTLLIWLIV